MISAKLRRDIGAVMILPARSHEAREGSRPDNARARAVAKAKPCDGKSPN
jgi:hypothetical protein